MADLSNTPSNTNFANRSLPSGTIDPFPPELLARNLNRFQSSHTNVRIGEEHSFFASSLLPVHGTSVKNALKIIEDGAIKAYSKLVEENSPVVSNNRSILTDVLDIRLGLHQYVFLSLGRLHPVDIHPVYFICKNNLLESTSVVVSLREIANFGALVSKEAEDSVLQFRPGATRKSIEQINIDASEKFFAQCFTGSAFRRQIFPKFLAKNYRDVSKYCIDESFPGTKLKTERLGSQMIVRGAWEGPQVMVKDGISLEHNSPSVFIPNLHGSASAVRKLTKAGFPEDRIFTLEEALGDYMARFTTLKPFRIPFDHACLCRLALRDLSLLAQHNDFNQNFPESMTAYKHRLD